MVDIKFTKDHIELEGPVRCTDEVHGFGFSMFDRHKGMGPVQSPTQGERWVWYADNSRCNLWSGKDLVSIDTLGYIHGPGFRGEITAFGLFGQGIGDKTVIRAYSDFSVRRIKRDPVTGERVSVYREDQSGPTNIALSHEEHDTLALNRGGGYAGGVRIEGAVAVPGSLTVQGQDVHAELAALRAEVEALKKKVG